MAQKYMQNWPNYTLDELTVNTDVTIDGRTVKALNGDGVVTKHNADGTSEVTKILQTAAEITEFKDYHTLLEVGAL